MVMSDRKIMPSGRGIGVELVSTNNLVVCVTAEYLRTGSGRFSKHRSMVLSLLRRLWQAHTIDTSHTLRVQTEQNRRTPDGRSNDMFMMISSIIRDYLVMTLDLRSTNKVRKHNLVFQVIMYDPKDPDQSFVYDTILVVTENSIQQFLARTKSSPLKSNEFEVFLKSHPYPGRNILLAGS